MKALKVLKDIYSVNSGNKSGLVLTYSERMKLIKESITELEALQSRSCDNCLHEKSCDIVVADNKKFYCSDWESK